MSPNVLWAIRPALSSLPGKDFYAYETTSNDLDSIARRKPPPKINAKRTCQFHLVLLFRFEQSEYT
ncbi:uncharacterized protein EAE98_010003 [Botrytis deweyae]|uniref:Uncharacterized protein n=1 Tax=Botrytis deweyae TaxID=2478750 RepID=A0ABQ7IA31_9HELO|nr:uncharacterized protein EAE98_010003 [Botrytis deweyae]KAF7917975.1 hypothetical protein EAE98_010003 [Botrytis deweyae]